MKKHLKTKSNLAGQRTHGFLKRMATRSGRNVISSRRKKGRWSLSK